MASLNSLSIIGYLGRDPEMRFTPDGNAVTSFSVAISNKSGDREETTWFNIVTWDKRAEQCNEMLHKGDLVYVEGRVRLNRWENKAGEQRSRLEVIAWRVESLMGKEGDEEGEG